MSHKGVFVVWFLLGLTVFLIAACGGGETPSAATPTLDPADTAPTQTSSPTPSPVLTSKQVFSLVSPSVAFIETPIASGSAILIEGGYLLTNAHVVHGFDKARVVFPDGSDFPEVPVNSFDDLVDLAVLGPIDTDINPLKLHDREDLEIGSDVYLVGYPAEVEESPQPTITPGVLSHIQEWPAIEMTYFQTDAAVTGGHSGGALVSELGEIIGISGLQFSEADFSLVASAADVAPLADALIQGNDASALGSRPLTQGRGQQEHQVALENPWDVRTFLIDAPVGMTVEVQLEGVADGLFTVLDPFGSLVSLGDSSTTGLESVSFEIDTEGRHSVSVGLSAGTEGEFTLSAGANLIPVNDPDDGFAIGVGDIVAGSIDFIGDLDYFLLDLVDGETVEIRVESMNIDAELTVDFPGSRPEQVVGDDDSGGGLSGTDSIIFYRPILTGVHYLVINDAVLVNTGGYLISVNPAPEGAAATAPTRYSTVDSPFGPMSVFENAASGFSAHAPADWREANSNLPASKLNLIDNNADNNIIIVVEDLTPIGLGGTTLAEYSELVVSLFRQQIPDFDLLSEENVQTTQGLDAVRIEYSAREGDFHGSRLIYLNEDNMVINISIHTTSEQYEGLRAMIDYIFESFRSE